MRKDSIDNIILMIQNIHQQKKENTYWEIAVACQTFHLLDKEGFDVTVLECPDKAFFDEKIIAIIDDIKPKSITGDMARIKTISNEYFEYFSYFKNLKMFFYLMPIMEEEKDKLILKFCGGFVYEQKI